MSGRASAFCQWCGNTRADHAQPWSRCFGFSPKPAPTCRVCGRPASPQTTGRDDVCYRHRLDA